VELAGVKPEKGGGQDERMLVGWGGDWIGEDRDLMWCREGEEGRELGVWDRMGERGKPVIEGPVMKVCV